MTPPSTLGAYRIDRELGRGGMGVVYLGYDTRLDRPVAIKALPEHLLDDPDRLGRFEREARTLAALSHPNIGAIYGLEEAGGRRYLVLEYVDGETLDSRLARGALPIDDALALAGQVAEALEAAHEKGIVHRDLKPGNIVVTPAGAAKVLDFGLARTVERLAPGTDSAPESPTRTSPGPLPSPTIPGAIMGTAGYMSPEQARGRPVDRRSDIFSFGCILYEMLTGIRPFAGDTVGDLIGAVLHTDVDLDRLPPGTSPEVRRVIARCLQRDMAARYRDIGDVLLDLRQAGSGAPAAAAGAGGMGRHAVWVAAAAFGAGVVLTAALAWLAPSPGPAASLLPKRFGIGGVAMPVDAFLSIAVSPDGTHLAVRGFGETGTPQLYLRALDAMELVAVPGSEAGWLPFFSPDGRQVAFFALGRIRTAPVSGGAARTISETPSGFTGGVWLPDDTIVFTSLGALTLHRVRAGGGPIETIPVTAPSDVDMIIATAFLPDGGAILGSARRGGRFDIAVISLADGALRIIDENGFQPVYSASGHILYQRGDNGPLVALPFDAAARSVAGRPFPVISDIGLRVSFQTRSYDVARDGTLVFVPAVVTENTGTLVWVDPSGLREVITRLDRTVDLPRLSHDGRRLAFRSPAPNCDIWVYDLERGTTTRLTYDGDNHGLAWSPDDERIATFRRGFTTGRPLWIRSDGAGAVEPLHDEELDDTFLVDITPDGRHVFLTAQREGASWDISIIDAPARHIRRVFTDRFDETGARLSPDGRMLAYVSNESGRNEIYVQPFPSLDSRVPVSIDGGSEPAWSRDGRTLYFRRGNAMLRATVHPGARLQVDRPVVLFEGTFAAGPSGLAGYDVSADGRRFVMVERDGVDGAHHTVEVIVNFFAELERIEPR